MLQKSARFILAAILAVSLCPAIAFADEAEDAATDNPLEELISAVTGVSAQDAASKTQALYAETGLATPPLTNTLPGFEAAEGLTDGGILLGGAKGYLFYLREAAFKAADGSTVGAYHTLECYSVFDDSWDVLDSLPGYYEFVSAAIWNQRIYLVGTPMGVSGNIPQPSASPTAQMLEYDISEGVGGSWAVAAGDNIPVATSLVNYEGRLELVGGVRDGSASAAIWTYDSDSGELVVSNAQLSHPVVGAKTVTNDSTLYVYTYGSSLTELRAGTGTPSMIVCDQGSSSSGDAALPDIVEPADMSAYPSQSAVMSGSLATADSGVLLVGPTAASGGTDTYRMRWDSDAFGAYSQTAANEQLSGGTCFVYLGNLYAVGSVLDASGNPAMIFRSTPMANATVLSGNNGVWRKGSTDTLDFRFSPNFGRFSDRADVDDSLIVLGNEYESEPGSTIIRLRPEYLEELEVGSYILTTWYDDELTPIHARFVIEEPSSVIPDSPNGYTQPVQLAPTGDMLPVIPLALLVVIAAVVVAVAVYRKSRS